MKKITNNISKDRENKQKNKLAQFRERMSITEKKGNDMAQEKGASSMVDRLAN